MNLTTWIKKKRLAMNKTQHEMCSDIGLSYITYRKLECDKTYKPSYIVVKKIAAYFGINESEVRAMV